jgi:hypothetical protein
MQKNVKGSMTTGQLTGMAAVHYVAAELSQRCYTVAVTSRNARGIDILAVNPSIKTISIQVKANKPRPLGGTHSFWLLGKHDAQPAAMFYVFVNLNPVGQRAEFYVVLRLHVAKHIIHDGDWYQLNRTDAERFKEAWHILAR